MKCFIFLTAVIMTLYAVGFLKQTPSFEWMDRQYTTAIKGIGILTVVWAHSGAKLGVGGIQFIAGVGVSLFLICSGYGLEKSYLKNGLRNFWTKRLLGVCIPFWFIELIGLLLTGSFSLQVYLKDFFFIKSATAYGWYMRYIIICYLIFYIANKISCSKKYSDFILIGMFIVWFIFDSIFMANPEMPFLKARQMVCFPCGVLIAKYKNTLQVWLSKKKCSVIFVGGGIVGLLFTLITQMNSVKGLPYIVSNMLSLLTCFPLAIALLALGKWGRFFENNVLIFIGTVSYEIYLVHAFTLNMVTPSLICIAAFLIITILLAIGEHFVMKGIQNGRFNSCDSNKK